MKIDVGECCKGCVAPKRHLGCHDTCEERKALIEKRDELRRLISEGHKKDAQILGHFKSEKRKRDKKCQ